MNQTERNQEKKETDRYTQSRKREQVSATQREKEHQLFSEGNVKLPWIRQTAGSSPEKRENELG